MKFPSNEIIQRLADLAITFYIKKYQMLYIVP